MTTVRDLTETFVCPSCRSDLQADERGLSCPRCSTRGRLFLENFVDFLGGDEAHARAILGWRDDHIPAIEDAVTQADARTAEQSALLRDLGLLDPEGRLTSLGRAVRYNSSEFRWQSGYDPLEGLVAVPELTAESRVLDLGGGSGQTLRRLFPSPQGTLVCLDADLDIIAFGAKLFSAHGIPVLFCRASSHRLPLRDGDFDHIICRTMLNYTHQRRTLTEAVRVLRPGGWLFLRVENLY